MPDRTWSEIRPLHAEHGILQADVDGPVVFDEGLIAMVRQRLEQHPSPPVPPDEADRVMTKMIADVRSTPPPLDW